MKFEYVYLYLKS